MYLVDTNVFLEILLSQAKRELCKRFLTDNEGRLHITDFTLHSIALCVILFRQGKEMVFQKFVNDVLPALNVITLAKASYTNLRNINKTLGLDFDDAYQFEAARMNDMRLVTMDKDFKTAQVKIKVQFL